MKLARQIGMRVTAGYLVSGFLIWYLTLNFSVETFVVFACCILVFYLFSKARSESMVEAENFMKEMEEKMWQLNKKQKKDAEEIRQIMKQMSELLGKEIKRGQ